MPSTENTKEKNRPSSVSETLLFHIVMNGKLVVYKTVVQPSGTDSAAMVTINQDLFTMMNNEKYRC